MKSDVTYTHGIVIALGDEKARSATLLVFCLSMLSRVKVKLSNESIYQITNYFSIFAVANPVLPASLHQSVTKHQMRIWLFTVSKSCNLKREETILLFFFSNDNSLKKSQIGQFAFGICSPIHATKRASLPFLSLPIT